MIYKLEFHVYAPRYLRKYGYHLVSVVKLGLPLQVDLAQCLGIVLSTTSSKLKNELYLCFVFLNRRHNIILHFAKLIPSWQLLLPSLSWICCLSAPPPNSYVFYCISWIYWRWRALLFLRHFIHCCIVSKDCGNFLHFELLCLLSLCSS